MGVKMHPQDKKSGVCVSGEKGFPVLIFLLYYFALKKCVVII